ncbi:Jag N-terminal domain-containing protein [Candidatus Poriferisodalis sp.]|uniref:Jag N-terminal domain-containing protein n=1 Tax=Candidatus Poriferisodalis sp. TaxID=3101277 RepID=UPI003B02AB19
MEWIVVSGHTVAEARERGLDALSVAVEDADIEILAEPGRSHWGLRRQPARVRMRVRPTGPPPRVGDQRRDRRRSRRRSGGRQRQAQQSRSGNQNQNRSGRSSRRQSRATRSGTAPKQSGSTS